jgi:hypothetical protein
MLILLATLINIIHLLLILLIIASPFINNHTLKLNVLVLLFYILYQNVIGTGQCGLTKIEYLIMGRKYEQGFLYRIIHPMFNLPEKYFDSYVIIIHITLMLILLYQVYL